MVRGTPEAYVALGYAQLLTVWAWWCHRCPACGQRRFFDPDMRVWLAGTHFASAALLITVGEIGEA